MADFQGMIYFPYSITGAKDAAHADEIVIEALDALGRLDLGKFTWDDPDWSMREIESEDDDND